MARTRKSRVVVSLNLRYVDGVYFVVLLSRHLDIEFREVIIGHLLFDGCKA